MSSSAHTNNKGKGILILDKVQTQGLDNTTLTAETKYPTNFTQSGKRFAFSLHYNGNNSLFFNATKVYQFKAKDSEIKDYALCLGNVSKDFTINNMKKKKENRIKRSCNFFYVYLILLILTIFEISINIC